MESVFFQPINIDKKAKTEGKDIDWSSSSNLALDFQLQVKYNHRIFETIYPGPFEYDGKIREIVDAFDDVHGLDLRPVSKYQHVVLLHEKGKYQGHVFMFLHPKDDFAYGIGIRGRTDRFMFPRIKNLGRHILQTFSYFARKMGKKQMAITFPRDNMISILHNLGFTRENVWNIEHLETTLIPKGSGEEGDDFYVKTLSTQEPREL